MVNIKNPTVNIKIPRDIHSVAAVVELLVRFLPSVGVRVSWRKDAVGDWELVAERVGVPGIAEVDFIVKENREGFPKREGSSPDAIPHGICSDFVDLSKKENRAAFIQPKKVYAHIKDIDVITALAKRLSNLERDKKIVKQGNASLYLSCTQNDNILGVLQDKVVEGLDILIEETKQSLEALNVQVHED